MRLLLFHDSRPILHAILRATTKTIDTGSRPPKNIPMRCSLKRILPFFILTLSMSASSTNTFDVYFGTYTRKTSKGIYSARFDAATGTLTPAVFEAAAANPTFLARHPRLPVLYAIGERKNEAGETEGALHAFSIDPATRALTPLNSIPAGGGTLCYIQVDPTGSAVVVSSYGAGYVASYSLQPDGLLGARTSFHAHAGKGPHPQQNAPHAHCIDFTPDGRFALSADLGADRILAYRFDPAAQSLTPAGQAYEAQPGAGPRHLAFHPGGRFLYCINELTSTVTAFAFDAATAGLREIETIDTLTPGFTGRRWGAEIAVHPSGKFLYASNRADHESITLFAIDASTGKLTLVSHAHEGVKHPRHFAIDPTGRWLLCASHDTDVVVIFAIDSETGRLTATGRTLPVPSPVCILFMRQS
jgi:6-phosphogluconolactonase